MSRGAVSLLGLGLLVGCSAPTPEATVTPGFQEAIQIDGSSTVYPLSSEVVAELQFERGDEVPPISVDFSGTGGGFRKFCAEEIQISGASRPITTAEMDDCAANGVEYIELPVAFDALTIIVNEENDWADTITVEELQALWEPAAAGTVTQWNQVRPEWPEQPINLYGPDVDSGTYDYFTEAVVQADGESRQDYTDEVDDERIVRAVRGDENALGYLGFAYYQDSQTTLKSLAIDSGSGPVQPSAETVRSGEYRPLTRPLFIYVNRQQLEENPALEELVMYYLTNAPFLARTVGYTPLPEEAYAAIIDRFQQRQTGTVFDGEAPTDLTLERLTELEQ